MGEDYEEDDRNEREPDFLDDFFELTAHMLRPVAAAVLGANGATWDVIEAKARELGKEVARRADAVQGNRPDGAPMSDTDCRLVVQTVLGCLLEAVTASGDAAG